MDETCKYELMDRVKHSLLSQKCLINTEDNVRN